MGTRLPKIRKGKKKIEGKRERRKEKPAKIEKGD